MQKMVKKWQMANGKKMGYSEKTLPPEMVKNGQNLAILNFPRVTTDCFHIAILRIDFIQKNSKTYRGILKKSKKIGHFGPKLAIFDQKLAKMAKF